MSYIKPLNNQPSPSEEALFPFGMIAAFMLGAATAIMAYNFMVYDSRYSIYASLILYFFVPIVAFFGLSQPKSQPLTSWIFGIGVIPSAISALFLFYIMFPML